MDGFGLTYRPDEKRRGQGEVGGPSPKSQLKKRLRGRECLSLAQRGGGQKGGRKIASKNSFVLCGEKGGPGYVSGWRRNGEDGIIPGGQK